MHTRKIARWITVLVLLFAVHPAGAAGGDEAVADQVDTARLSNDIRWLADDDRNGRLATTEAEDDVVDWIVGRFAALELAPFAAAGLESLVHGFPIRTSFYPWNQTTGASCTSAGAVLLSGTGENIIAVLPGEVHPNEFVIVSAHHDHIGPCGTSIRNGADDNASGVAAMLEIARILSKQSPRPKKSVVFVAFAAEEIGRLGSKAFTRLLIAHTLDRSCVMLNLDMLGVAIGAPVFVTLFGDDPSNTSNLVSAIAQAARFQDIDVVSGGSVIDWSDHVSLTDYRIPAITMTASAVIAPDNGEEDDFSIDFMLRHHPNYHRSTDIPEALDVSAVATMTRVAVSAASILANAGD